jgi:cytoskeletal protein CcmA (bactofilin family)
MINIKKVLHPEIENKSVCDYSNACIITTMNGEVTIESDCILEGASTGKMNIKGKLLVKPSGKFIGTVIAHEIIVKGHLEGIILCKSNIRCIKSSTIIGKISSNTFDFDENIILDGEINQITPSEFDKKVNEINLVKNIPKVKSENFEINKRLATIFDSKPNNGFEDLNLNAFSKCNKINANLKKVVENVESINTDSCTRKCWF